MINLNCKILLVILLTFFSFSYSKDDISRTKRQLEETKNLIKEKSKEKKLYENKQKELVKELKNIEFELKNIEAEKIKLKKEIYQVKQELYFLEKQIQLLSSDIDFYYKMFELLLGNYVYNKIVSNKLHDDNFISYLLRISLVQQKEKLFETKKRYEYIQSVTQSYLKKKKELEKINRILEEKINLQKNLFVKKGKLLEEVKQKKITLEQEIKQLKQTQKELENLLKKLIAEKKVVKRQVVQINKKVLKPIDGIVISKFGTERKDNTYIVRNGIILQGISFCEVHAVDEGKVVFVSENFRSYGKIIIIEHSGGIYSVYGQLEEIKVFEQQEVKKGDIIAKTGSTGQIYFELRASVIPVDPELYFE